MLLYLRLAWRNVWRHKRRTIIIVVAMGLTLALMMFYDGLITGFEDSIYGNAIRVLGGNIQVHAAGYKSSSSQLALIPLADDQAVLKVARQQPNVMAASRRINTTGLITTREGAFAVTISGIEPEVELPVNMVAQKVSAGRFLTAADTDVVYIGKGMAGVTVGDRITLVGRAVHEQLRSRTVTVVGIFDVGLPDIEKRTVYMSLVEAQDLYGLTDQSTEIVLSMELGKEPPVIKALKAQLPDYEIASWETNFPELQTAISTKGAVMDIFGVIMLAIAAIGILNLLLMAIYERTREIGLLGALGLKPYQISLLFILEGTLIGLVGAFAGILMGLALNVWMGKVGFDYSAFAGISEYTALISGRVYSSLGTEKLLSRSLTVVIIAALSAVIPAYEAAQREPSEALHYV
jgi:putative ABC transport system permease protein